MKELFFNYKKSSESCPITEDKRIFYGKLAGVVGIITNICLSLSKLLIGLISGSLAIVADALNNLSDVGASVISVVTLKLSSKPADKEHPFGHARIEYVSSLIISFLILLVGFEMITDSIKSIISPSASGEITTVTVVVLSVAVAAKLLLGLFQMRTGRLVESSTIRASGQDSLLDSISTAAVLACSIIIKYTELYIIDSIVGLLVSLLIILAGIRILNETKNSILGEAPVEETINSIKEIVKSYPDVIGMHDLIVHNYGPGHFVASFHAEVDGKGDIFALHDTIDNIEKRLICELGILCTIHLDPILIGDPLTDELKALVERAVNEISPEIGIHDFRVVVGKTHTNLIYDLAVPFDIKLSDDQVKDAVSNEIQKTAPSCFSVITIDRV